MNDISTLLTQGLQIVWINILLSGDNAVVIALASRQLDESRRKWAISLGAIAAIALRIVFTIFLVALLKLPYVRIVSGVLLLWIAFQLLRQDEDQEVDPATSIWGAVRTIVLADAIMSLDNVVAVAAAARGNVPLLVFGIALSVPLIIFGASLVLELLKRFPILVVAGAALLGWVAGEIMISDRKVEEWMGPLPDNVALAASAAGAALVLVFAAILWLRGRRHQKAAGATRAS